MTLEETFILRGTDPETAHNAVIALASNPTLKGIITSGKIAAGKDTLAPLILRRLDPKNPLEQLQFAFALKNEVTQVGKLIKDNLSAPREKVAEDIATQQRIEVEKALVMVNYLHDDFLAGIGPKDGWDKTPSNRLALQFWGTQVRREQNDNYWVDKVVQAAARAFAQGRSVFITDARFVNEVEGIGHLLGFPSFRIDVSPEEQRRRFFKREGKELSEEATLHDSETALDDYKGFSSRVLTDGMTPAEAVTALLEPFRTIY